MKVLSEKRIYTDTFAGTADIITGIDDFNVDLDFKEQEHKYYQNGKELPSVTTLLSDNEYESVPEELLENARLRGNLVHKEISDYLIEGKLGNTDEFAKFLTMFTEQRALFEQKAIFDIKTYNSFDGKKRDKVYNQLQMYAEGVEYLTGEHIDNLYVIWLPKEGDGKIINMTRTLTTLSEEEQVILYNSIKQIKALEKTADIIKQKLLEEMENNNITQIKIKDLTISYVGESEKETFDSKALKENDIDTYNKYLKKSKVKSKVMIREG